MSNKCNVRSLSENERLVSELGYEIVEMEQIRHAFTFPTLDAFWNFFTATWHGTFDASEIYRNHRQKVDNIEIPTTDHRCLINYMVFKKPDYLWIYNISFIYNLHVAVYYKLFSTKKNIFVLPIFFLTFLEI